MATKMEVAEAEKWVREVRNEIVEVNKTLVDVTVACNEDPREDAIVCVVKKAGRMLNETWDNATKAYEDAWKNVNEGIDVVARASQEAGELFEQFIAKHR